MVRWKTLHCVVKNILRDTIASNYDKKHSCCRERVHLTSLCCTVQKPFWYVEPFRLLTGAADVHFKHLQSVQNAAARLVSRAPTSPQFLKNSTGFQCTRESYSRLWCWCGSVLMALIPATSPNPAFLLPLLQAISISGQPWRAYYTVSQKPWL